MRHILVTAALAYANGHLHLGHLFEHIQMDVYVRAMRFVGHKVVMICGSDAHGTPIMLKAEQLNIAPETLVTEMRLSHLEDFSRFGIHYDSYHTTHSPENQQMVASIYKALLKNGHIEQRTISQAFDAEKGIFLPDRYVKGICPKCRAADQYGDACEVCGANYTPLELINPYSVLSNTTPVAKDSLHYFFKLQDFEEVLRQFINGPALPVEVRKKLLEWFDAGLQPWDISRDAPYFGFQIPDTKDKYFYVWLDAPIGYMASLMHLCQTRTDITLEEVFGLDARYELYHFIGKDILYFHGLFWPALLAGSGHRMPTALFPHGFITVNGEKMSKSRGTFIEAKTYLKHAPPDALRYYFAAKASNTIDDIDFGLSDFCDRVNADIVGKLVNIASRTASFIHKYFEGRLASSLLDADRHSRFVKTVYRAFESYGERQFSLAIRDLMAHADEANRFVDEQKPWITVKDPALRDHTHRVCTDALNLFRLLAYALSPVLVEMTPRVMAFFNEQVEHIHQLDTPLLGSSIAPYDHLFQRLDLKEIECMVNPTPTPEATAATAAGTTTPTAAAATEATATATAYIDVDTFAKVDIRIAKIINAEIIPEADKLLKLTLDLGDHTRTVFAGIKSSYSPEQLIGRLTPIIANLAPRKMRFGVSEGMVIVAVRPTDGGKDVFLLSPDSGAMPGMKVQ